MDTWETALPRRKISEDRREEIEYRLTDLLKKRRAYGGPEIRDRLRTIVMLAYMWGVDVGPEAEGVIAKGLVPGALATLPPTLKLPAPVIPLVVSTTPTTEEAPAAPLNSGILDELGE